LQPPLLLSACAASPPAHGKAKGGVIDWFGTNSVQAEADRRKQYGKLARITEMRAEAGGHYCLSVFEGKQKRIRPTVSGGVSR
jgi:hypothetical protein